MQTTITLFEEKHRKLALTALVHVIEALTDDCRTNELDPFIQLENKFHQRNQAVFRAPSVVWQAIDRELGKMLVRELIAGGQDHLVMLELQDILLRSGGLGF